MGLIGLILLGGGLLGLAILFLGIRGKRVSTAPHCRKCRFDLSGLDRTTTCPECGASLEHKRAISNGLRRTRWITLAAGALCLLFVMSAGVVALFLDWTAWNDRKPTPVLHFDTEYFEGEISDAAAAELMARRTKGTLSDAQLAEVIDRCLEEHANGAGQWSSSPWGTLLNDALMSELLTDAQLASYAKQVARPAAILYQKQNLAGADYSNSVRVNLSHTHLIGSTTVRIRWYPVRGSIDGEELNLRDAPWSDDEGPIWYGYETSYSDTSMNGNSINARRPTHFERVHLEPGRHEVAFTFEIEAFVHNGPASDDQKPVATWRIETEGTIEVFATPEEIVEVVLPTTHPNVAVPNIGVGWARRGTRTNTEIEVVSTEPADADAPSKTSVNWTISRVLDPSGQDEVDVLGRVEVLHDGRAWPLFHHSYRQREPAAANITLGASNYGMSNRGELHDFPHVDRVDLRITPDIEAAARAGLSRVWGEPIHVEDVELNWLEEAEER